MKKLSCCRCRGRQIHSLLLRCGLGSGQARVAQTPLLHEPPHPSALVTIEAWKIFG